MRIPIFLLRSVHARNAAEGQRISDGIATKAVAGMDAASHLTSRVQTLDHVALGIDDLSIRVDLNTAHGVIRRVEGIEDSMQRPGVIRSEMLKDIGETAGDITNSLDRVGYVIGQGETVAEAVAACEAGLKRINVIVE